MYAFQECFKYNILSMFKKGFIPAALKNFTLVSDKILRKLTKIMFLEDINAAK